MADENHGQMLLQQSNTQQSHLQQNQLQPSQVQQQSQLQQPQLQQNQMQTSQIQQSQIQQSQLQPSQLQQSQLQQSQMQQSQLQQSHLQQSQIPHSQLQQSQIQQPQMQPSQLQQSQMHQSQLQQAQMQQSPMQQPSTMQQQPQSQTNTMSVEQSNMNITSSVPINVATLNVSQSQQMQAIQQSVNTSSGTPVHMAVSQLTAQGQTIPSGTMMSQSSVSHPTMMHPTMTMAQTQLPQVQVIQQPLSGPYLQHLYSPQQQMLFPSNLTLQHGMGTPTLQSLGGQGLSLQLQAKPADAKSSCGQNMQTVNKGMTVNAGTMVTASGQVIGTTQKANFPQQMMTGPGKSTIIHSQSGFAPTNTNQTVVIGQFGVVPNQQSIFNHKAIADSQKGKTYTFQSQPTALQPKSLYSSAMPVHSSTQLFNGGHVKQLTSQPQLITTQSPSTMFTQAQLLGLQALSPLPPGLSWATPGCSALLGQNPIIIRSQQSDMYIQQSQPQAAMHLPVAAAATQPVPPTSFAPAAIAPMKQKQVKVRPVTQAQTCAVATQTNVSSAASMHSNTVPIRTQIKPKVRTPTGISPGTSPSPATPVMATTQTQTQQSPPQQPSAQQQQLPLPQQKSDAGNQTYTNYIKPMSVAPSVAQKSMATETKQLPSPQKSQAMVAPSTKVIPTPLSMPSIDVSASTVNLPTSTLTTVSSTTPVLTTSTVHVNTSVSTVNAISSTIPTPISVSHSSESQSMSMPIMEEGSKTQIQPEVSLVNPPKSEPVNVSVGTEHLKPQQPIVKPSLGHVNKDKQPQKAIVKPQVLTHVIDGMLIQEGPEPFPVSRSALLDSPCRILPPEKADSNQKRKDTSSVGSPEKKMKTYRARGNVELAKCEFCGKLGPKNKFKRSKRFCSNSCAKRFNARSKRADSLPSDTQEQDTAGGPGRKKKFRGRKGSKKQIQSEGEETNRQLSTQLEDISSSPSEDVEISNKTEEEISEPSVDSPQQMETDMKKGESEEQKSDIDYSQKLPTKWSVQDVFDFIQNLPGCSDYADTFKSQEIDGQALLLLKEDHLMSAMCMKLGPALKLISQIRSMREATDF